MRHSSKLCGAVLAMLVALTPCQVQAYQAEIRAYEQVIDGFFTEAFAARDDCDAMGVAMATWLRNNDEALVDHTRAVANAFGAIRTRPEYDALDAAVTELWGKVTSDNGLVFVGACMNENAEVAAAIKRFDEQGTDPISIAREATLERLSAAAEKNRPPDLALARLAADTLQRALELYTTMVSTYQGDCKQLARAVDAWHGSYFAMLDQPSRDLIGELERMSEDQRSELQPSLDAMAEVRDATGVVAACLDQLDGDAKERLSFHLTFLGTYVVDSVLANGRP